MGEINATNPRIVAFGDNDADCYAAHGLMYPGGNALNVAVFARRAGADTAFIGAVADDPAGRHIRAALRKEQVDVSRLRSVDGRTAFCSIGTAENGEREFVSADLGVSIIAPDASDLALIATADALHTGRSAHVEAHLAAFASNARLSFDFADQAGDAYIDRVAPMCFLASFSGSRLSTANARKVQARARRAGATWCLVTRGREGAILSGPGTDIEVAAVEAKVVDTLGAGDSFIARVLVGLLRREDPASLMQAAAAMAAATCADHGGFGHPALIDIDDTHAMPISRIHSHADYLAREADQRAADTGAAPR